MGRKFLLLIWLLVCEIVAPAFAAVSEEEAKKLGNELTPMGAERAGNAAGTIPAYTGKILGAPSWVDYPGTGNHYPEMYPNEKPLFYITASNIPKYEDHLTPGLIAILKKFPNSFRLPIYTSHRDVRYSDRVHQATHTNALNAELVQGVGVNNAHFGTPFPLPKNGAEVIWNHIVYQRPWSSEAVYVEAAVYPGGSIALSKYRDIIRGSYIDPSLDAKLFAETNILAYYLKYTLEPVRQKGEIILVHEYLNQDVNPRAVWAYIPGTRRVRRAPTVGYDNPSGVGGLRTDDERTGFNGAIDRYHWKLLGKREVFIPYHNYKFENNKLKYKDIMTPKHPNPDLFRFELHRVWVVEATLKRKSRHIYARRQFFIDEDSWMVHLADNYDSKDNIWRSHIINSTNAYDLPGITGRVEVLFDLQNNAYVIDKLYNEEPKALTRLDTPYPVRYFTPGNLRRLGNR